MKNGLIICMRKKDAVKFQGNANAVYPSCPESLRLLRLFLKINTSLKMISNALMWADLDFNKVQDMRRKLLESIANLENIASDIYAEVKKYQNNKKQEVKK